MKKYLLVLTALLSGCMNIRRTEDLMREAIGQDVRVAFAKYGAANQEFDMPNGTRAFQWVIQQSHTTGSNAQAVYYPHLNMAMGMSSGNRTTHSACVFTVYGQRNQQGGWTIVSYEPPRPSCEFTIL